MVSRKVKRTEEEQKILDHIIACMNYKELDQKELCDYLGVNQQMFTNWKNGQSNSYMKRLSKIAEFLDIPMDELINEPIIPGNTVYEKKLLKYFSMCDGEGKLRIIQLAMNEFDRTQKEKKENQEPAVVG